MLDQRQRHAALQRVLLVLGLILLIFILTIYIELPDDVPHASGGVFFCVATFVACRLVLAIRCDARFTRRGCGCGCGCACAVPVPVPVPVHVL